MVAKTIMYSLVSYFLPTLAFGITFHRFPRAGGVTGSSSVPRILSAFFFVRALKRGIAERPGGSNSADSEEESSALAKPAQRTATCISPARERHHR